MATPRVVTAFASPANNPMPLTKKGRKIESAMIKQYGKKRGEAVFYASRNKGIITGVDYKRKKL
jgi:hypothetical protein